MRRAPRRLPSEDAGRAVLLSAKDYDRLSGRKPSLAKFMRASPLAGIDLTIDRDRSPARDVEL